MKRIIISKRMRSRYRESTMKCLLLVFLAGFSLLSYAQVAPDWTTAVSCNLKRPATDFHIKLNQASQALVTPYSSLIAGDMDGDGIDEIVALGAMVSGNGGNQNYQTDSMFIFQGDNLNKVVGVPLPQRIGSITAPFAMGRGKIGGKDSSIIVVATNDNYLYAFNKAGQQVWKSDSMYAYDGLSNYTTVQFADLMGDGNVDIIAGYSVFNMDGQKLLAFDSCCTDSKLWVYSNMGMVSLADVTGDKHLDYVIANAAYKFNIVDYTGTNAANTFTLIDSVPGFSLSQTASYGKTTVADMDGDGKLDAIVTTRNFMYVWNPRTGVLMDSIHFPAGRAYAVPFVGDLTGNGTPDIVFCTSQLNNLGIADKYYIYAYNYNKNAVSPAKKLNLFWALPHSDGSGMTGMTLFDFNADGIMEIVYRDEDSLRIINGSLKSHLTGNDTTAVYNLASFFCGSGTASEYPLVADVNGSGSANIVVVGDPTIPSVGGVARVPVNIYSSVKPGAWAWARPVWNQYMYNGVNVNQDLTIPQVQMPAGTWVRRDSAIQSIAPYPYGDIRDSVQPYNSFFQQHSLESAGKYVMAGSALAIGNITQAPDSTNDSITFTIPFTNSAVFSGYPATDSAVAFYCGDSSLHNVLWVGAMPYIRAYSGSGPYPTANAVITVPASVLASCTSQLMIVLNDKGNGTGDSTLPGECNYGGQDTMVCASFINDDNASILKGASQEIRVRDNDVILQPITGIDASRAHIGSAVLNLDSTITYTSDGVNVGVDSILYYTNVGCLDSAWLYVTVTDTLDWTNAFGCQVPATPVDFHIKVAQSSQPIVHPYAAIVAGDMDGDGVVEIASLGRMRVPLKVAGYPSDSLLIFQGNDLSKYVAIHLPSGATAYGTPMAMVRGKMYPSTVDTSLLIVALDDGYLYAYNKSGQQVWKSDTSCLRPLDSSNPLDTTSLNDSVSITLSVADINGDGNVNILAGNAVFNLAGKRLLSFQDTTNNGYFTRPDNAGGVLSDVDGDGKLEYIAGMSVFKFNLTNPSGTAGNSMVPFVQVPGFAGYGSRSVAADMDGDGKLDIVSVGNNGGSSGKVLFVWNPRTGALMDSLQFSTVFNVGSAVPFVGDIDGDGSPEIVFCTSVLSGQSIPTDRVMKAYKYNVNAVSPAKKLQVFWSMNHSDQSGWTGMSLFDFNADGTMEICYRDQDSLRIMNGSLKDGNGNPVPGVYNLATFGCSSGTLGEMPIIIDANGDGSANMVITGTLGVRDIGPTAPATLNVFSSVKPGAWAWARPVWNQYMYNAVNVNDNLTIPKVQTNSAKQLWDPVKGKIVQPYNSFFQQHSYEDQAGNYVTFGANLSIGNITQAPDSTGDSIVFTIPIKNLAMHMGYPASDSAVAFYCGNASGPVLWVGALPQISANDSAVAVISVPKSVLFTCNNGIFIQLNDKGQGNGAAGGMLQECNLNNESATVCVNVLENDYATVRLGASKEVKVRYNDSIQQSISYLNTSLLQYGTAVMNGDSTVTYTSDSTSQGIDSFAYITINSTGGCFDSAWVVMTILPNDSIIPNPNGAGGIGANAVVWNRKDLLTNYNGITVVDTAQVEAYDSLTNHVPRTQIYLDTVKYNYILSRDTVGIYPMTYYMPGGLGAPEYTLVFDNDSITPNPTPGIKEAIGADNYTWNIRDLANLNLITSRDTAHVTAMGYDSTFVPRTNITQDLAQFTAIKNQKTPAVLPLTYTTPKGTSVTVKVTLLDNDTVVPGPGASVIGADVVVWKLDSIASYTMAIAPDTAHVTAFDQQGVAVPRASLTADLADWNIITGTPAVGVYDMKYSSPDTFATEKVFVLANDTITPDPTNKEVIGANHFTWNIRNLSALNAYVSKDTSHLIAYDYNGSRIDTSLLNVDAAQMATILSQTRPTMLPLTFSTAKGTSVTVKVTLLDNDTVVPGPGASVIGADVVVWKLDSIASYTMAIAPDTAHVTAFDQQGVAVPRASLTADLADWNIITGTPAVGVYDMKYSSPDTFATEKVFVLANDTITPDPTNKEVIGANHFTWNIRNLSALNAYVSKDTSHLIAYDYNGSRIDTSLLNVDAAQMATILSQTRPTMLPLTFSTAKGTSVTVKVTLLDNDTVVPGPGASVIGADVVVWKLDSIASYTMAIAPDTAHVTAFDQQGVAVPRASLTADLADWNIITGTPAVGVYDMKYSSPDTFATEKVFVLDNDTITPDPTNKEVIGANHFTWNIRNLSALNADVSKDTSHLIAYDYNGSRIDTSLLNVDAAQMATILSQTRPTMLPLTFSTAKGTSVTVKVTLLDNDTVVPGPGASVIGADVVVWKLDSIASYTMAIAPDTAHVTAFDQQGVAVPRASLTADLADWNIITGTPAVGVYDMKYSSPDTFATEKVFVLANDTITPDPTNKEVIGANHFTWNIRNLSALNAYVSKDTSHLIAYDYNGSRIDTSLLNVDAVQMATILSQTRPTMLPLTFSTAKGTSVTVKVTLLDNDTVVPGPGASVIGADVVVWKLDSIASYTMAIAPDTAHVTAFDQQGVAVPRASLTADLADWNIITGTPAVGVYDMKYSSPDTFATEKVFVLANDTITPDPTNKEVIGANHFTWNIRNLSALNAYVSKDTSHLIAYDYNGSRIDTSLLNVDAAQMATILSQTRPTMLPLTFSTAKGTSVTVKVTLLDNDTVVPGPGASVIGADVVVWKLDSIASYTMAIAPDTAHVTAFDQQGVAVPRASLTADLADWNIITGTPAVGVYDMKYSSPDTFATEKVFVLANDTITPDPTNKEVIGANHFTWNIRNLSALNAYVSKDTSHLIAYDYNGSRIDTSLLNVDAAQMATILSQTRPTMLPLTFSTAKGTSVTVKVTLLDNDTVVPGPGASVIGADVVVWKLDSIASYTMAIAPDTAHVTAFDQQGVAVPRASLTADLADWNIITGTPAVGVYDMKYSSPDTFATEKVFVLANDTITPDPTNKEVIGANHFTWNIRNLSALNAYVSKDTSHLIAYDYNGSRIDTSLLNVDAAQMATILSQTRPTMLPLTFSTAKGTSVTVKVTLLDNDTVVPGPGASVIGADVVVWKLDSIASYTMAIAPDTAHVTAFDQQGVAVPRASLTADLADWNIITGTPAVGVYDMKYSSPDTFATEKVFVLANDTITPDPTNKEVIGANHFTWNIRNLSALNAYVSKDTSHLIAYDYNGSRIDTSLLNVDAAQMATILSQTRPTMLPLTFSTAKGTSVTVKVTLLDNDTVVPGPGASVIGADVVVWKLDSIASYTMAIAPDTAHVTAFDQQGVAVPRASLTADLADWNIITGTPAVGVYDMKYSSPDTFATEKVFVLDNDTITPDPTNKEVIGANHFTWNIRNLSALNADVSKDTSHLIAYDYNGSRIDTSLLNVDAAQMATILSQTRPTMLPLTFSTAKGTSVTVKVTLLDNDTVVPGPGASVIGADVVVWKLDSIASYTMAIAPDTAHVTAFDQQGVAVPRASLTADLADWNIITGTPAVGVYDMKYSSPDTFATEKVFVLANDTITPDPTNKEVIGANHFTWNIRNLSALNAYVSKDTSHLIAYDYNGSRIDTSLLNVDAAQMATILSQTRPTMLPLTFSTAKGTSVTVKVTLLDNDTVVPGPGASVIGADVVVWKLDSIASYTMAIAPDTAHVTAFDQQGVAVPRASLTADLADWNIITGTPAVGVYDMKYSSPDTFATEKVFVLANDTITPDPTNKEVIGANHFTWNIRNLSALNAYVSKDTSHLIAYDYNGSRIDTSLLNVDAAQMATILSQTRPTMLPLTFSTAKGTSVTVKVTLLDNDTVVPGPGASVIGADVVVWKLDSIASYTMAIAPDTAHVTAFDQQGVAVPRASLTADLADWNIITGTPAVGVYDMKYSSPDTFATEKVFVLANDTITPDPTNKEVIGANHFTWNIRNLSALNAYVSKDTSHLIAYDYNGSRIDTSLLNVDAAQMATILSQTRPTMLPLTFSTAKGTSVTVKVTLLDNDTVVPGPGASVIGADVVVWKLDSIASYTMAIAPDTAHVTAFDQQGVAVPRASLTADLADWNIITGTPAVGVYDMKYSSPDTFATEKVFVLANDTITPDPTNKEVIGANHFTWNIRNLSSLNAYVSKDTANVTAYAYDGTPIDTSTITTDAIQMSTILSQTRPIVLPLTFKTAKGTAVTINVTLLNNDTIVPGPGSSAIGADVVFWNLKDLASYTLAIAPDTAHVVAFDQSGVRVPRTSINANVADYDFIMSKDTVGSYPMQYSSPDTSVIAPVFVFDHDSITPNPTAKEVIAARDFVWPFRDRVNMNASKSKNAAKVIAFAYDGGSISRASITANAADLRALQNELTVGSDSLTFTTPSGKTSTRIKVTLVDNDTTTVDPVSGEAIGANNIAWNIRDLSSLSQTAAKDSSEVHAEYRDGSVIPRSTVTVNPAQFTTITTQTTPGVWPLTYTTPNGVSVTVNVALLDNDSIHVDPVKEEVIGADNFAFYVENLGTLDNVVARDTAHTKAFNMITGAEILRNTLLVDPTMLTTIKAQTDVIMLPLKFTTPNGTPTTINVTLMVDSTGTYSPTCNEYLGGRDFSWSIDSLNSLDEAAMYTAGKIRGIHTDGSGKMIPTSEIILNPSDVSAIQNAGNSPDTTIALRYTTVSNCVEDTLLVHINGSVITNPDFAIAGKVLSVPLALCANTCDVDQDYVLTSQLGVDTMKNQAKVKITLQGNYHVNATIHFKGATGLFTSSVADGGTVALNSQGSSSQVELSIDRNKVSPDTTKVYLTTYVTIAGKTDSIKILFSKDFDEDGIANVIERSACIKKTDGLFNEWYYTDPYGDADHDGIINIVEAHGTMDSLYNTFTLPGTCIPDFQNEDSNGDGVPDGNEKFTDNTNDTINDRDIYVRPAVSANADGLGDDKMFIENINFYSNNTVTLFDRVGRVLYQMKGYNNADKAFDGYPNKANNNDKKVPMGTYYYYVEYTSDKTHITRSKAGFIEVRY